MVDGRGIRVGFVSRLPLGEVEQVDGFLDGLPPVQVRGRRGAAARWGGQRGTA